MIPPNPFDVSVLTLFIIATMVYCAFTAAGLWWLWRCVRGLKIAHKRTCECFGEIDARPIRVELECHPCGQCDWAGRVPMTGTRGMDEAEVQRRAADLGIERTSSRGEFAPAEEIRQLDAIKELSRRRDKAAKEGGGD